jgi:hypothetical protein
MGVVRSCVIQHSKNTFIVIQYIHLKHSCLNSYVLFRRDSYIAQINSEKTTFLLKDTENVDARRRIFSKYPPHPPRLPYSLQLYVKYGFSVIRPSAVLYLKYGRGCKKGGGGRGCKKGGGSVQRR